MYIMSNEPIVSSETTTTTTNDISTRSVFNWFDTQNEYCRTQRERDRIRELLIVIVLNWSVCTIRTSTFPPNYNPISMMQSTPPPGCILLRQFRNNVKCNNNKTACECVAVLCYCRHRHRAYAPNNNKLIEIKLKKGRRRRIKTTSNKERTLFGLPMCICCFGPMWSGLIFRHHHRQAMSWFYWISFALT